MKGPTRRVGIVEPAITDLRRRQFRIGPPDLYRVAIQPVIDAQAQLECGRRASVKIFGDIQRHRGSVAGLGLVERHRHLAVDPVDAVGAAPGPFTLDEPVGRRIDLVGSRQGLRRADRRQQRSLRIAVGMPVEDVYSGRSGPVIATGDRPRPENVLLALLFRTDKGIGKIAVVSRVDGDVGALADFHEAGDVNAGVGDGVAGRNQDVDEALVDPFRYVIADSSAGFERPGDSCREIHRPAALFPQVLGHAPDGALQIGERITQAVGFILGKVKGMALPVELDAVPVVDLADLLDVIVAALPDLGNRHVPGKREPFRGAVPQQPFWVFGAQRFDAIGSQQRSQIADLGAAKVVVVHPYRRVHVKPELVAALDQCLLRILAAVVHLADVFRTGVGTGALVASTLSLADELQHFAGPARSLSATAPEQGVDLGIFEGGVGLLEKSGHGLGCRRIPVWGAVPVVDDSVLRAFGHVSLLIV